MKIEALCLHIQPACQKRVCFGLGLNQHTETYGLQEARFSAVALSYKWKLKSENVSRILIN
jgi:hypothetical protein